MPSGGSSPSGTTNFKMNANECQCLVDFLKAQRDIISRHLDEHKWLRHIEDKNEAASSFINDYGWLMRELYCTRICEKREGCEIANQLSQSGDLLKNHIKEVKDENAK